MSEEEEQALVDEEADKQAAKEVRAQHDRDSTRQAGWDDEENQEVQKELAEQQEKDEGH